MLRSSRPRELWGAVWSSFTLLSLPHNLIFNHEAQLPVQNEKSWMWFSTCPTSDRQLFYFLCVSNGPCSERSTAIDLVLIVMHWDQVKPVPRAHHAYLKAWLVGWWPLLCRTFKRRLDHVWPITKVLLSLYTLLFLYINTQFKISVQSNPVGSLSNPPCWPLTCIYD